MAITIRVCRKCGLMKKFKDFVVIPKEVQVGINMGHINVDTCVCPDCEE